MAVANRSATNSQPQQPTKRGASAPLFYFPHSTSCLRPGAILNPDPKVDLNLETLKGEILDYLSVSDFGVFRGIPGGLEGLPIVGWDSENFPDYRMFLEAARKAGQKLIVFASRQFEEEEILDAIDELEGAELDRDESREYEARIRGARRHVGSVCTLELAFDYNSHLYVYEMRPDWYDDFLAACEEISSLFPGVEDSSEDEPNDSLGGFYSNN